MQPQFEVADVLHLLGDKVERLGLNPWQLRTLSAIRRCRTSALGGHVDACDGCGNITISYNSCRNRHCPKCQGNNRQAWIQARETELLPVPYFHVVFTIPQAINTLAMYEPRIVYSILFQAAWQTINVFGKNKKLKKGMIAVLHTWGQNLSLHPHLHCIIPGGGIDKQENWKNIRTDGKFLFSVKALSKVFRAKYCEMLKSRLPEAYQNLKIDLWKKPWIIYAKRPFGSPKSVIEYLGRYTHKIAISNHRIKSIDKQKVTFVYKDYKDGGTKKNMQLTHEEFIRRFSLHILPKSFVKIRHFGFLSSTWKRQKLGKLQAKMKINSIVKNEKKTAIRRCPCCKKGLLQIICMFDYRGPPLLYLGGAKKIVSYEN